MEGRNSNIESKCAIRIRISDEGAGLVPLAVGPFLLYTEGGQRR